MVIEEETNVDTKVAIASDDTATTLTGGPRDFDDEDDDDAMMPLLNYARLALPTAASATTTLTCSAMAQVWLDTTEEGENSVNNSVPVEGTPENDPELLLTSDLWKQQPHWVLALGKSDGTVSLLSVGGSSALASQPLMVVEGDTEPSPVVSVSLDASGSVLAALDEKGRVAIWELTYGVKLGIEQQEATRQASTSSTGSQQDNVFSSFMSTLTGVPPPEHSSNNEPSSSTSGVPPTPPLPTATTQLTANVAQVFRIAYPHNWSKATCLALDPAYKRKREKSLVIGFLDGRLLLTKRGGLFQRRSDTVLYQGAESVTGGAETYKGILSVTWRGNLVAWADATGIKLLDIESLARIAHIDRPSGARPTLYPTISNFLPTLYFEQADKLLIAWGDCLMGMVIHEKTVAENETKRKIVQCDIAWELDCVACGVIPLDQDHVVVLGVVPPEDDECAENDLEVQIIRRQDGTVRYGDSLPLKDAGTSQSFCTLLSSFALPRMEDSAELEESRKRGLIEQDIVDLNSLFAPGAGGSKKPAFKDSHLQWNVESVLIGEEEERADTSEEDDTHSVDSDDYDFVLRPIVDVSALMESTTPPPFLVVASASDLVLARMSSVDDAVFHALLQNKCALALSRGLRHRRQLRRYELSDLVNRYLEAVLRLDEEEVLEEEASLSLRRMQLAVNAMPVLLGGRIDLWERWAAELGRIPGSLFFLRNYIPVRDPILPPSLYENILRKMLTEIEQLVATSHDDDEVRESPATMKFDNEAANHFLESLVAWGPTKTLKDYIKLYQYSRDQLRKGEKSSAPTHNSELRSVEISLQRRYLQTAACYLNFPVTQKEEEELEDSSPRYEGLKDDSKDSLYNVESIVHLLSPRAPLLALPEEESADGKVPPSTLDPNNRLCLEAMARLRMMQNRHDLALKCFLSIGACHSPLSMEELEESAIDMVHGVADTKALSKRIIFGSSSYEFVLGTIEFNHLHRCLLDENFILPTDSKPFMPLFALLRIIGLPLMGRFLMDHCVSPELSSSDMVMGESSSEAMRRETLPIDRVAQQLEHSPPLLYWYLHLVFLEKPELYVKFPNNAIPPKTITQLHQRHFQLHVDFAGDDKDSAKSLSGTETYKVETKSTPLLSFLKAALPLGGVLPVDARRQLEIQRSQSLDSFDDEEMENLAKDSSAEKSRIFSLELAYIIENYFEQTEAEAFGILDLYLQGANSLMLAVSYAQRQRQYSAMLWDKLIDYCLSNKSAGADSAIQDEPDGILFGALLEAAALSGADLARLVERIPPGMVVEGLRPRLVAAVADYRLKLDIHNAAAETASGDRVSLLREVTHRSRRGVRYEFPQNPQRMAFELPLEPPQTEEKGEVVISVLPKSLKTVERRDRHSLAYSIPMR